MDLFNEKKEEIFNTATYLFSKKGYMSTSVQDIAKACNISKATIYKCFNSKEDILIYIIKYFNNQMVRLVDEVNLNDSLSPIKRYEEKIYTLFNTIDLNFNICNFHCFFKYSKSKSNLLFIINVCAISFDISGLSSLCLSTIDVVNLTINFDTSL